jgi:hypothetical protein
MLLPFALLPVAAAEQAGQPRTPPGGATAPAEAGVVRFRHIRIDTKERRVILESKVCMQEGPLELLVCKAGTKEYESVLSTEADGAHLHAALLALKLTPGLAAQWSGTGEQARFLPPRGPELSIKLKWKDNEANIRLADAGSWLKHVGRKASPPDKWVFIGSRILPNNRYWADVDGDIISVANFESAVIDVPFESTTENEALEFAANSEAIPPVGTPVEVIIAPLPGAERSPYARAMLEIDPQGHMRIDGRDVTADGATKWAEKYIRRHAMGYVLIRADARALVDDVNNAIVALRRGGVRDFDIERLRRRGPILPRSDKQVQQEMKAWKEKFSSPQDYIVDPARQARTTLKQIELELRQLEATKDLLEGYTQSLRSLLGKHNAGTDAAEGH